MKYNTQAVYLSVYSIATSKSRFVHREQDLVINNIKFNLKRSVKLGGCDRVVTLLNNYKRSFWKLLSDRKLK